MWVFIFRSFCSPTRFSKTRQQPELTVLHVCYQCVKFHPNSLYLATGSSDRSCRLWDVQKGTCVRVFVGHGGPVTTIAMSPDGRYLASAGECKGVPPLHQSSPGVSVP